jgi:hypothetical protein
MQQNLTQITLSPAVAGDGKLPASLMDTGLPLYSNVMDAVDQLEDGLKTRRRRVICEAHAQITGPVRLIQAELCHEYRTVRPDRDTPDLWSVTCSSGNFGRPFQHPFCEECVFFDTTNSPKFKDGVNQRIAQIIADGKGAAA